VVVKWPRFAFEKFPGSDPRLGTQMKSVGEAMSIGRTFCESLQKARARSKPGRPASSVCSTHRLPHAVARAGHAPRLEARRTARAAPTPTLPPAAQAEMITAIERAIGGADRDRLFYVGDAIRSGISLETHSTS